MKGFTLIELLAVIVILAIIALIATPIVLSIINDSKESAVIRSAEFYVDAVKNAIMQENMKQGGTLNPEVCSVIPQTDNIDCDGIELEVEVDGEKPSDGSITFDKGKVTGVNLIFGGKKITINKEGSLIYDTSKLLKEIAVISAELGVNSVNECASSSICEIGTPFAIKVNNEETYKFYVINDNGNEVTMIMNKNLIDNVEWYVDESTCITEEHDYNGDGVIDWRGTDCDGTHSKGPLTALKALKDNTANWTNIPLYSYELNYGEVYDDSNRQNRYVGIYSGELVQNVRARLPKTEDFYDVFQMNAGDEYIHDISFLEENIDSSVYEGYWLSDASTHAHQTAWVYASAGCADCPIHIWDDLGSHVYSTNFGVRPIIIVNK